MDKKFDIVTAMDLCVDFLIQMGDVIPKFGQKEQMVEDYAIELGGSCCIFACQAAKLGLRTAGLGALGDDLFGRLIMDKLNNAGVNTERIRTDHTIKTGMGAALCKRDGDRAILTYSGSIDAPGLKDMTDDILASIRHLHIGSYFLMKKLQPHYPEIIRKAKKNGVTVSLDTNWDSDETWDGDVLDLLPLMDIFQPNENEIMAIMRKNSVEEAVKAALELVPVITLKSGKNGAAVITKNEYYHVDPVDVPVVDTVGAGDSFDAGFVYGFLSGFDMQKCLQIGSICGSLNTRSAGGIAGQPLRNEMEKLLQSGVKQII